MHESQLARRVLDVVLDAERLAGDLRPLSTHGISVAQAIMLAHASRLRRSRR